MRFREDVTPFAPNCSEGAPVRQGSDPVALSLDRLVQECPVSDPAWTPAYHADGSLVHVRLDGKVVCWDHDVAGIAIRTNVAHRYTDAQRDYWSRKGQT